MTSDMKPRITHIYFATRGRADPQNIKAGGFSQVLNYTSRWRERGVHFHVIMPCAKDEMPDVEQINGVYWHRYTPGQFGMPGHGHEESLCAALQIIDHPSLSDDEAHLLMPTDATPFSKRILQRAAHQGIASVMPVHMFHEPVKKFSPRDWIRVIRERQWYKPVTAIHANSEVSALALCQAAGKPESWAKVIVTGVNTHRFLPARTLEEKVQLRRKLGLPEDKLVVLFVGGATRRKGVDFLLNAWERMVKEHRTDAVLAFVGGNANRPTVANKDRVAYAQFAEDFDRRVQEVRKVADIRLFEHVSTVEEFYRAADVFAFPSLHEGLPNAVLEAMASGLPVLSTRFLGFPHEGGEFGYEGQHFISLPRDTAAWAEALVSLGGDAARRERMGLAARRWMECFQDLDMVTGQSAEFFHGLARSLQARSRT